MKLHILSDLHLEFHRWPRAWDVASIDADATVLAGDIGVGLLGVEWALSALSRPTVLVLGNHEFYGQRTMDKLFAAVRRKCAGSHVHLLENEAIVIGDVRFVGATLWTDFALLGKDRQAECMAEARQFMTDYQRIRTGTWGPSRHPAKLTPAQSLRRHRDSRAYLEAALADPGIPRTVVVTHHAPSVRSLLGERDLLDAAYASDLEALVPRADLWIHGHTHAVADYRIGPTPVLCNPRGYADRGPESVPGFRWDRVVTL